VIDQEVATLMTNGS